MGLWWPVLSGLAGLHGLKYRTSLRIHHNQKERAPRIIATIGFGVHWEVERPPCVARYSFSRPRSLIVVLTSQPTWFGLALKQAPYELDGIN
ncbi:hypothetical protein BIY27_10770 [Gibbsiella quercinecans]|nr:hypothetical protein BIY27_10770 [Gibbsiella quercinecans]